MTTDVMTDVTTRTYTIDRAHSEATFQVRHLVSKVRGDSPISRARSRPTSRTPAVRR
jgi:hypothetical protein